MTDEADLTALHAISCLASGTDDPGAATREILELISRVFGSDSSLIAFQNPETQKLEIEAGLGLPADAERSLPPGQGIPGWVAWHARPLLVPDSLADPRSRPIRGETRCEMAAPLLLSDGRGLGVVALGRDLRGSYGAGDLARLVRLSDEAARVLGRLWDLRHLRGKARQLEALIATGQALVGKLEQRGLFDTLTRDASAMMQARACAFFLHDPRSACLRLASYTGEAETLSPEGDLPLRSCLFASVVHARRPVSFADIRSPEFLDLLDLPRDPAIRSVLAAPMLFEGEVLGVLAVFTDRPQLFDDDEIRNPLTVLKLLHGGLGLDFAEGDPRRTDMRVIGEKLDQLEAIVTRVLNFARAPTSLHSRYQAAEIVGDTLVLIRLKLAQSKIRVSFEPPARSIVVEGHKGQLQQVLLNLLINSMQAMPEGGDITLRLGSEVRGSAQYAVIDVADTGSGIPDAVRERIFDSFLTGRPDGTGLGLAIAKRILQGHNGDISLVSSSPAGTTLQITLPLARA